jgi:hypothetical protein
MKKKMEKLNDELFRPLDLPEGRRAFGASRSTPTTIVETNNPNSDFLLDGEGHN